MTTYRLHPMVLAEAESPEPRVFYLGDPTKSVPTVFLFWLLTSNDRAILVDTGFTAEFCARFMPDVVQKPHQHPLTQLDGFGVQPDDIEIVVSTHAHFDHLSEIVHRYENATVYLQRREFHFVTQPPHPWFAAMSDMDTVRALAGSGPRRLVLLEGDSDICEGVRTITTPGHTAGHQSVLVETQAGTACICADASFFYRNIEEDIGPGFNCNLIEALASLQRIRDTGAIVLPGHEPQIFQRYPKMPIL